MLHPHALLSVHTHNGMHSTATHSVNQEECCCALTKMIHCRYLNNQQHGRLTQLRCTMQPRLQDSSIPHCGTRYHLEFSWQGDWLGRYRKLHDYCMGQNNDAIKGLLLIADEFENGIFLDASSNSRSPPLLQLEREMYEDEVAWREGMQQGAVFCRIQLNFRCYVDTITAQPSIDACR